MSSSESVVTGSWGCEARGWSILVHGGAGAIPAERRALHIAGCERAAEAGAEVLAAGGSALDAVERAVEVLENDPSFNAGTGACLNADGAIELDASIMEGSGLRAGGVAALPPFLNPIRIARGVMEETPHVLLAGEPAARFAIERGFVRADPESMITDRARAAWETARRAKRTEVSSGGTVGAVAKDSAGHLAAATSTGGMVNKLAGRVGDSAIVGSGTYADDGAGACSTTGHGESMIRLAFAKTAIESLRAPGSTSSTLATPLTPATLPTPAAAPAAPTPPNPEEVARRTLAMMHGRTGGTGGAIIVGPDGSLGLARTTVTMSWAARSDAGHASGA